MVLTQTHLQRCGFSKHGKTLVIGRVGLRKIYMFGQKETRRKKNVNTTMGLEPATYQNRCPFLPTELTHPQ